MNQRTDNEGVRPLDEWLEIRPRPGIVLTEAEEQVLTAIPQHLESLVLGVNMLRTGALPSELRRK
jgi:hypothetical protein